MTRLMEVKIKIEKNAKQCCNVRIQMIFFCKKIFLMVYFVANQTVLAKNDVFDPNKKR